MSYLIVPGTGQKIDIFGEGGGKRTAEAMDVPFLGQLPLNPNVRVGGDTGRPIALLGEANPEAAGFYSIARQVVERCASGLRKAPTMSVED
jgi:ATP-binding protein involved in chromosome partitioning